MIKKNPEDKQKGGGGMSITKEKVKSRYESLSPHVKALLESDEIKQWSNDPTIYFVAGLKKLRSN